MVRKRTKLVVFLGTPHRGSEYAGWAQIASNLARLALRDSNKKILETLEVNNEILDNIHEEFKTIVHIGTIKVHSFQEAQGITGMKGVSEKVCCLSYGVNATLTAAGGRRLLLETRPPASAGDGGKHRREPHADG